MIFFGKDIGVVRYIVRDFMLEKFVKNVGFFWVFIHNILNLSSPCKYSK